MGILVSQESDMANFCLASAKGAGRTSIRLRNCFAPQSVLREFLTRLAVPLLLLAATLASGPAFAQVDLSGEWGVRFYEDSPDRGPGPEVGDYLGLPINAAARARAN